MGCIYFYGIISFGGAIFLYALVTFIIEERNRRKLERWNKTPKDEVILHGYPRGKTLPSPSPFPLKVETYLRLTNIKYRLDVNDTWGPKGKTPWISLNGKHIGDSEFIINYLNKKFERDLNTNCKQNDVANARILRVMLEEFLTWAVGLERFVYGDHQRVKEVVGDQIPWVFLIFFKRMIKKRAYEQGIGRHSKQEVTYLMSKYLKDVSIALGTKKYFGGEDLCQEDCGIFGVLAQFLWGIPGTPYESLMNNECKNLKDYCIRLKERAWPDWDNLIQT